MSARLKLLTAALLALSGTCLYAKEKANDKKGSWDGHIQLDGGSNFSKDDIYGKLSHNSVSGEFLLGYKRPRWQLNFFLSGSFSNNIKTVYGLSYNDNEGQEKLMVDVSSKSSDERNARSYLDALFTPSDKDKIALRYSFNRKWNKPSNMIMSFNYLVDPMTVQASEEETDGCKNTHILDGKWTHRFDRPGMNLDVTASWESDIDKRYTEWYIGKALVAGEDVEDVHDEEETVYTPLYSDSFIRLGGRLSVKNIFKVENLDAVFALNLVSKLDSDKYYAEDLLDGIWVERERYTADYEYYSFQVDPTVSIRYTKGKIAVEADVTPEYYNYSLSDLNHPAKSSNGSPEMIGLAKFIWNISQHHILSAGTGRSIKRPEYLQMCWFQRPGVYSNELYEGNADLVAASTNKADVNYKFSVGRFAANLGVEHTYAVGTIEQTYHNEVIDGKDYRVYTWINAGHSYTTLAKVSAAWNGRRLHCDASFNINWFRGFNQNNSLTQSNDYNIKANVAYDFPKGWYAKVSARYQSDIKRNYTSLTDYVGLNVRVSKAFRHFDVFIEGTDLLDDDITKTVLSYDQTQGRMESINYNRRLFRLGVKYRF